MVEFPKSSLLIDRVYEPDEDALRRAVDILLFDRSREES
jgi:hypothetical protein